MPIASLLTIFKQPNQPRYPTMINKYKSGIYIHTMEYYSPIKKCVYVFCRKIVGTRDYHVKEN
jgi:hypothetical protein